MSLWVTVMCARALGASIVSVGGTAGENSCAETGTTFIYCEATTGDGIDGPVAGGGVATGRWEEDGRLEAIGSATGPMTSGTAAVNYFNTLLVRGASGRGNLRIEFFGFVHLYGLSSSVSPISVGVGTASTTVSFPGNPSTFSAVLPVEFGVPEQFTVSFDDAGMGTTFPNGSYENVRADALLVGFPTFVVTDANGTVIPGAAVQVVPEPGTWGLLGVAFAGWWAAGRRTGNRSGHN